MTFVNFRIVGIYYNKKIELPITSTTKVQDLINAAVKFENGKLIINQDPKTNLITTCQYTWDKPPKPNRPAGIYRLAQNLNSDPAPVFQYYIERPLPTNPDYFKLVSKGKFLPPNKSEPLKAGDSVLFRLVQIDLKPS
jgi:hypothetical protein